MVVVTAAAGTGGSHKVLLIPGKQSSASSSFSRPISVVLPSQAAAAASSDSDSNSSAAGPPVRKRQRLTHLSPEEKALRRKLKNRVAAQTARDRKKAKMGELEQQVLEMEQENQKLHIENRLLREKAGSLLAENQELRQRLCLDTLDSKEKVQCQLSGGNDAGLGIGSSESAALRLRVPPQQVQAQQLPKLKTSQWIQMLLTLHTSDLLLGILDILDPELFLRSCEQELQEPQQQVQQPLPVPPTSLAALGAPSVKLEALNELIHFDHIYTKPVVEEEEEVVSSSNNSSSSSDSESDDKMDEVVVVVEQQQEEVEVEVETVVCIKDEPEEVELITGHRADFTSSPSSSSSPSPPSSLSGLDQDASLADTYSDSGYERSPSPFSQLPSPLDAETSWDSFASELFPQLITV